MRNNFRVVFFVLAPLLSVLVAAPAWGQTEKFTIGYTSIGPDNGWIWVAEEMRIFKKYGLDPQLVYTGGGTPATMGLIGGSFDVVFGDTVAVLSAIARGADIVILASPINRLMYSLVGSRDVKEVSQLKGKKVGVNRFGAISDIQTQIILKRSGVDPKKDVTMIQVGGSTERLGALHKGMIGAALLSPPRDFLAKRMGLNILQIPDVEFISHGLSTKKDYYQRHPSLLTNFLKAMIEAIYFYKSQPSQTIEILMKHLRQRDFEVMDHGYKIVAERYSINPVPDETAIKATWQILKESGLVQEVASLKDAFVFSLIEEINASGFIAKFSKR